MLKEGFPYKVGVELEMEEKPRVSVNWTRMMCDIDNLW